MAAMRTLYTLFYCCIFFSLSSGDNYTEFKGLAPEEAKTKLAQLIKDEVDLDKDDFLTEDEIRQRLHVTTKEYRKKEVMETMKQHDEGENVTSGLSCNQSTLLFPKLPPPSPLPQRKPACGSLKKAFMIQESLQHQSRL